MRGFVPFLGQRLFRALIALWLVSTVVFVVMRLSGDPVPLLLPPDAPTSEIFRVRRELGLDKPLPVQYLIWLGKLVRGDLGVAYTFNSKLAQLLAQRAPASLELALAAMALSILFALPTGILAAVREHRAADWLISTFNGFAAAVPGFWLGILAIMLFALSLGWLPPGGRGDLTRDPVGALKFLALPAITLALPFAAGLSRLVNSSMLEVLGDDYVRTARAKGVPEWKVMRSHVLRNAMLPVVTMLGMDVSVALGGAIFTESVYSLPGLGRTAVQALNNYDIPTVMGVIVFSTIIIIVFNLVVDLLYAWIDPRIRLA